MGWLGLLVCVAAARAVKLKVVARSDEDSRLDDETPLPPPPGRMLPFLRTAPPPLAPPAPSPPSQPQNEEYANGTERNMHPNELIFPLIYRQSHINSMFKFGDNWYTWSEEKRPDGSRATNYYICYDEPKRCDEIGWERTDSVPKCAFQIDSLLPDDRACVNAFGVEPHNSGACDGAEQMKVSEMVRSCGPRIRSLWRFVRAGRRPAAAAKPADVNSLVCEDEEECYISIEYRIHHDRITFSLHEPARGQTFKSALKREPPPPPPPPSHPVVAPSPPLIPVDDDSRYERSQSQAHSRRRSHARDAHPHDHAPKLRPSSRHHAPLTPPPALLQHDNYRRPVKNRIKTHEDVSDDTSE